MAPLSFSLSVELVLPIMGGFEGDIGRGALGVMSLLMVDCTFVVAVCGIEGCDGVEYGAAATIVSDGLEELEPMAASWKERSKMYVSVLCLSVCASRQ